MENNLSKEGEKMKIWKKTSTGIGLPIWQWEKKDGSILKIGEMRDYNKNGEIYYEVRAADYHPYLMKMLEIGKYKTKAQAIKFAKSYMRTH